MANEPASHAMDLVGFSEPPRPAPDKEAKKPAAKKKRAHRTAQSHA
jgi:hypothetical protein